MNLGIVLCCLAAAGTPAVVRDVEQAFRARPELLEIHRGYVGYMDARPDLERAEVALNALRSQDAFRRAVVPFEEWLLREPEALPRYLAYLKNLDRHPPLQDALTTIAGFRKDNAFRGTAPYPGIGLEFDAGRAARFLRNPRDLTDIPPELVPYVARLQGDGTLRGRLLTALETVETAAAESPALASWWRFVAAPGRPVVEPVDRFNRYLAEHPHDGDLWRARAAPLTDDPNAFAWIAYWHGRARRDPLLAPTYYPYLAWLYDQTDDVQRQIGQAWQAQYGNAPEWPPASPPPPLAPQDANAPVEWTVPEPERPHLVFPKVPDLTAPTRPKSPQAPSVPRVPQVPVPKPRTADRGPH